MLDDARVVRATLRVVGASCPWDGYWKVEQRYEGVLSAFILRLWVVGDRLLGQCVAFAVPAKPPPPRSPRMGRYGRTAAAAAAAAASSAASLTSASATAAEQRYIPGPILFNVSATWSGMEASGAVILDAGEAAFAAHLDFTCHAFSGVSRWPFPLSAANSVASLSAVRVRDIAPECAASDAHPCRIDNGWGVRGMWLAKAAGAMRIVTRVAAITDRGRLVYPVYCVDCHFGVLGMCRVRHCDAGYEPDRHEAIILATRCVRCAAGSIKSHVRPARHRRRMHARVRRNCAASGAVPTHIVCTSWRRALLFCLCCGGLPLHPVLLFEFLMCACVN